MTAGTRWSRRYGCRTTNCRRKAFSLSANPFMEYQAGTVRSVRRGSPGSRQQVISFPGVLEGAEAKALLDDWMRRVWAERESVSLRFPPRPTQKSRRAR